MVVKSKEYNRVFGGYTSLDWTSDGQNYKDTNALLFSIDDSIIYPIKQDSDAVIHLPGDGPSFFDLKF